MNNQIDVQRESNQLPLASKVNAETITPIAHLSSPCADYFLIAQENFQFSEDIPTVINHRAGKGWLDYFRGFVGEIPLSGSEDYRNIFSNEISRTINSFLPPPQ